jgi:hypothetical protein
LRNDAGKRRARDERRRARVLQDELDLGCDIARIDGHADQARLHQRKVGDDELGTIREQDGHTLAFAEPERAGERGSEPVALVLYVGKG